MAFKASFFVISCLLLLSLVNRSFAQEVVFTSSATSVEVGATLQLTCELKGFKTIKTDYSVYFNRDDNFFFDYRISEPTPGHPSVTTFSNETTLSPTLLRHPLSSTFPIYQITITPTVAGTHAYSCNLYVDHSIESKIVSITATPPPPLAHLSFNVTSVTLDRPFTATCSLANFHPIPDKYSVQFASQEEGILAVYEVQNDAAILSHGTSSKVTVSPGIHSKYPTFDLVITEKVKASSVYWCALEETGKAPVLSDRGPASVNFTASKLNANQREGTCSIGIATRADLKDQVYSVQFVTHFTAKDESTLLAEYVFKENLAEEFISNLQAPWTSISHGSSATWPVFSLHLNGTDPQPGTWWCLLAVGQKGTIGYREYKSNSADL